MLIKDTLYTGEEAREKLMSGIKKCADAVGSTMGTGGANSIIECIEHPNHFVTNDGATILASIHLSDPIEEMGRKILLEAVSRANKASGDGSSTTCVLTSAILEEGMKHLDEASPMDIKKSLEECIPLIEESIKKQTREITVDEVGAVASLSAEDEKIGAMIQEIYKEIGKEGIIHWDISKTAEDSYQIGHGITVEGAGYYSPYMCDATESGQSTNQVRIKNPTVLITTQKITSASEFNDIFEALFNKEIKDVVVFCDEVDPLVIPDLIKTRMVRGFRTVLVKMPTLWKDWWYEDLALASGAKIISLTAGLPIKNATLEHLGTFDNILITKSDVYIDGVKDMTDHVKTLEEEGSDDSKLRASRLNTKTARYFVGAQSDSALSYRRLKVEDAISAAWQALNGGIVAGGGVALRNVSNSLSNAVLDTVGGRILRKALRSPMCQIASNSGFNQRHSFIAKETWFIFWNRETVVDTPLIDGLAGNYGLDSRSGETVDMFEVHITDPSPIVLNSIKNAVSVAASILTANTLVILPREEQLSPVYPHLQV